jgi:hypothetical protein
MKQKIEINRSAMETGDRLKNGESRRNFMKRFALLSAGLAVFGRKTMAQKEDNKGCGCTIQKTPLRAGSAKPMQMTNAWVFSNGFTYNYPEEYQKNYPMPANLPDGYLYFSDIQNPFRLILDIQVIAPVKVKYSLYTFKKTFAQDGKRNYYQGIDECGLVNPITTQADIDKNLDKIYEFPVVAETASGQRELPFYGYTDPKFTGQKYAVRDCLYIAVYNADTGELIDTQGTGNAAKAYQMTSAPGILYRLDEHKDANGKVVKETLSGIVVAVYPNDWPIKKITALITVDSCGYGALTFDVFNQGADAIVADINSRIPGSVLAHITLTNPTLIDKNNPNIKTFDWKDIKGEDGKDFIPDLVKNPEGYKLAIIIETDEMTFTGIQNGSLGIGNAIPPVPRGDITANEPIEETGVNVVSHETGFTVYCSAGVLAKSYAVHDPLGRTLKAGSLSGAPKETIPASDLRNGIYFVQLKITENGTEKTVSKKVVRR